MIANRAIKCAVFISLLAAAVLVPSAPAAASCTSIDRSQHNASGSSYDSYTFTIPYAETMLASGVTFYYSSISGTSIVTTYDTDPPYYKYINVAWDVSSSTTLNYTFYVTSAPC